MLGFNPYVFSFKKKIYKIYQQTRCQWLLAKKCFPSLFKLNSHVFIAKPCKTTIVLVKPQCLLVKSRFMLCSIEILHSDKMFPAFSSYKTSIGEGFKSSTFCRSKSMPSAEIPGTGGASDVAPALDGTRVSERPARRLWGGSEFFSGKSPHEIAIWLVVTGTMGFYDFPFSWEGHHPNWRSPSFFRGVGIPPTSHIFWVKSPWNMSTLWSTSTLWTRKSPFLM